MLTMNEGILGYIITILLIGRGLFKVYKMIPVPILVGNSKFTYIDTGESNLSIDQTRQYCFKISNEELNKCKMIDSQSRICRQTCPLLSSHLHEACVVKLLQQRKEIPRNCDTRLVQIRNTIWTQLANNERICFAPAAESVTVLCMNHDPEDVTLTGIDKICYSEHLYSSPQAF
jgi:hypothetical protein